MRLKSLGRNKTTIEADGVTVFFSYERPVACHIEGGGFFISDHSWSPTTSKHIAQWIHGEGGSGVATERPQKYFDNLLSLRRLP